MGVPSEVVNARCCGLDVHKETVVACVRLTGPQGQVGQEVRTFGTTTRGLLELGDWLAGQRVTAAAMESTGVYWKPVWNLLEGRATVDGELIVVMLEDANVKLASVATDVLGVSGREMLGALIAGKMTPAEMADLARMSLRKKIPQLVEALTGGVTDHHRFMLRTVLDQVEYLEKQIGWFDERIEAVLSPLEQAAVKKLDEIPGFDRRSAQNVLAEIGTDMSRFPTSGHLASWAGMCPGNNESAGKRRSGRMCEGNKWLKRTLTQTAWAGSRAKTSYFKAQHARLSHRRGRKRATMAVGHSQLCIAYELLKHDTSFKDLGADYFDNRDTDRLQRQLVAKLERLGCKVTIETKAA